MIPLFSKRSYNTEVDGSITRILNAYQNSGVKTYSDLAKIFEPLQNKSVLLSAAINRLKVKSEQQTKDEVRDEKITGLYYLLVSFSHHPDAEIRQAALNLLDIFDKYGLDMKNESYTTESSLVNSLLSDYSAPKQQADIALIPQCAEYISALQTAQTDFENTRVTFETARAEEGTLENATGIKKELIHIINKQLVPYLNVMAQLNESVFGAFARTVEEIISDNNEVVKKRRKQEKPEEDNPVSG
jgi:hypothetical protein